MKNKTVVLRYRQGTKPEMTTRQALSIACLALESEVLTMDRNKHRNWYLECKRALPVIKNLKRDF
jgi:hypothetical protein